MAERSPATPASDALEDGIIDDDGNNNIDDNNNDDDDTLSIDSDPSVIPEPEFEIELPWFRRIVGSSTRTPDTRSQCKVVVRLSDKIGALRERVKEQTGLLRFQLRLKGSSELLEEDPESEAGNTDDDDDDDDDDDGGGGAQSKSEDKSESGEDEDGEGDNEEDEEEDAVPTGDNRTLGSIGMKDEAMRLEKVQAKEEAEAKKKEEVELLRDEGGDDDLSDVSLAKDAVLPPQPLLPATEPAVAEGEDEEAKEVEEEEEEEEDITQPSAVIELEELDEALDGNFFAAEPESSEVLLQRAINGVNTKWWLRAADGNISMVKVLWEAAERKDLLNVNWRNPEAHDRTALMACALRGQKRTLEWLIKHHGARVNGFDDLGCTALNLAARGGYPKAVRVLLRHRANPLVADKNGWTPAVWALTMGHLDVLQEMADSGLVDLTDLGRPAPFDSAHISPTTLMPLPAVRYKADQYQARQTSEKREMAERARAHAMRQEKLRRQKEAELLGMQEALKARKVAEHRHKYMRDARENWDEYEHEKPGKKEKKNKGGSMV